MIILLNYPIESQSAYKIKQQTNTPTNLRMIEQQYNRLGTKNVYEYMVNHVISNPGLYGKEVSALVKQGQYSEAVDATAENERTMVHFSHLFDDVYAKTFAEIKGGDSKLVITFPHNTTKPSNVDIFVGWTVSETEYEVDHMEEHEGIRAMQGHTICDAHNKWMKNNKHIYDVFFDGSVEQEVLEYIQQL